MRNPEGIDLSKYPPPPGYVVASEEDVVAAGKYVPDDWMVFWYSPVGWTTQLLRLCVYFGYTYLRPITPDDQGDKYDTDHMFPG